MLGGRFDYPVGLVPYAIAAGDMNGDGLPDLAVANSSFMSNSVTVLLGAGGGSFYPYSDLSVAAGPRGVAIADLDGDGKNDIATANWRAGAASVLRNLGGGSFATRTDYDMAGGPTAILTRDLSGDGNPDLIVVDQSSSLVSVLLATCN